MTRYGLLLVGILLGGGVAFADNAHTSSPVKPQPFFGTAKAEAVLQNPLVAVSSTQGAINTVQPGAESIYDFHHHRFIYGTSMALWNFSSRSFPLGSLRAGYAGSEVTPYAELQLDLPGLTHRFVPSSWQTALSPGALDGAWKLLGKYALVGGVLGFGFDQSATGTTHNGGLLVGFSLGAKFTF